MRRLTQAVIGLLVVLCAAMPAVLPHSSQRARQAGPDVITTRSVDARDASFKAAGPGAPEQVLAGTVFVPRHLRRSKETSHSEQEFFRISTNGSNDMPSAALAAYRKAAAAMGTCQLSWTLLAAVGRVESDHGRYGGAVLGSDGVSRPQIVGPQLNGAGPFAAIRDTDMGTLDRDPVWDHAVGQMQFLPGTWRSVARDGDGDGVANPNDINDSALAAAVYLCRAGGDLSTRSGMARAAFAYNHSDYYVSLVLAYQLGYETGVFVLPSPPAPTGDAASKPGAPGSPVRVVPIRAATKQRTKAKPTALNGGAGASAAAKQAVATATTKVPDGPGTGSSTPTGAASTGASGTPGGPSTPSASPSPSTPDLTTLSGTWSACGGGFCVGGSNLNLGSVGARTAHGDFDGDGTVKSNVEEFAGLAGTQVTLRVARAGGTTDVYTINGLGFRNADGSFA